MTVIELGDLTSSPAYEPATGLNRRVVRNAVLAVTALVALCTLTWSVPGGPPPDGLRPLWNVAMNESDGLTLGPDAAYVTRMSTGPTVLTAYELATGAVRWEAALGAGPGGAQLAESADLLLAAEEDVRHAEQSVVALDARTGRRRWTTPGQAVTVTADAVLTAEYGDSGTVDWLRLVRLRDGATVWYQDLPGLHSYLPTGDRVVTATMDGRIEVRRLADGTRLAGGRVRWITPDPEDGLFDDVMTIGDRLVVNRHWPNRGDVTVYRIDTLAELWHADYTAGYTFGCARTLCALLGKDVIAYDLDTGARRWRWPDAGNAWAPSDDRMVVETAAGNELTLLDAGTGRPLGAPVRAGTTAWTVGTAAEVFLMNLTRAPAGRTAVIRWDTVTGRSRLLGSLDLLTGYRCQVRGHYLACNRADRLEVTAVG